MRIESLPDSGNSYRFDGIDHTAPVSFVRLHTLPGEGPGLHRHPDGETFIIQEGEACSVNIHPVPEMETVWL